jgi:GNAT superfamily N-acetyltransferase
MNATIRRAGRADAAELLDLIDALADYEKMERPTPAARERLVQDAFGARPRFDVLLAEGPDGIAGYALFFETYSSFLARPALWLEDLFVRPDRRGGGHGLRLLRSVAGEARRRGCARMEWNVLRWNQLAIDFYVGLGAAPLDEWQTYRLEGASLDAVAGS